MDPRIRSRFRTEIAAEGAARYGLRPEELSFIGGFQNFIYSYAKGGDEFILRFTPESLRTPEDLEAELEWIRYLASNGVAVSEPISASQSNGGVERISGDDFSFYAISFKRAPGRSIGYPECLGNPSLYERCGRLTGRLHELARLYKPTARRHGWERNHYLLRAREYLPDDCAFLLAALDDVKGRIARLPISDELYGLIHADINVGNFTVDAGGAITLFDFDECQYSWFAEDIAIQLYYLLYVFGEDSKAERKAQYELFLEHFAKGYTEEGRRLPEGWKDMLPLFLRLREMIVRIGMHRSWDLREPDDWTRDFLRDSRMRIANGVSVIDGFG
ncbi:phosphotransferase enzyme family protein [Paenibacillus sp.]|uniref:phosphotransferase enzyme family protein n=1 Tax=Paenibacillus sp. TaxID=58172 RepID=UPI002D42EC25|nr:phosphotransferase [Paenibacillus sp.]HZG56615.1 phosphotransferase [Paenibacillus sp.]